MFEVFAEVMLHSIVFIDMMSPTEQYSPFLFQSWSNYFAEYTQLVMSK